MIKKWLGILILGGLIIILVIIINKDDQSIISENNANLITTTNFENKEIENINPAPVLPLIYEPIDEFKDRITKKTFGINITPATSPVQPERFSGYHTGVDVEYEDVAEDLEVRAMTDGKVVASRTVNGYGGVLIIEHELLGEKILALYGHLDSKSMISINTEVIAGQQIAVLGEGYTDETDGERKHLHFGIIKGATINYKGYVSSESELSAWNDPLSYY